MKESYGEGPATHTGSESCSAAREDGIEALTGVHTGGVFSRERTFLRGADAVRRSGRPYRLRRHRETYPDPARSETPSTCGITMRGNREIPASPVVERTTGRVGKPKGRRR